MALICCPECNNKVSNSAISCPNCGYAIKEHIEKMLIELEDVKFNYENEKLIWQYCMECGEVLHRKKEREKNNCDFCGGTSIRYPSVTNENIDRKTPVELNKWKDDIKVYVQNENGVAVNQLKKSLPSQVQCPKCGGTQIQAVTRKWSLLTGFLTNKIDRVCLNCKHKF